MYAPCDPKTASTRYRFAAECIALNSELMKDLATLRPTELRNAAPHAQGAPQRGEPAERSDERLPRRRAGTR